MWVLGCGEVQQRRSDDADGRDAPQPGAPDQPKLAAGLRLNPSRLRLSPGTSSELGVVVSPPGEYTVRIALQGQTDGAYVDDTELRTDSTGRGTVWVTARTDSIEFSVQASVGHLTAVAPVKVDPAMLGTVLVTPIYSGQRTISEWHVALSDRPCAEVDVYRADYSHTVGASSNGVDDRGVRRFEPVQVPDVLAGQRHTVLLKGNEYVGGCREGIELGSDGEQPQTVALVDRPMQMASIDFPIRFGMDNTQEIAGAFGFLIGSVMAPSFKEGATERDIDALLRLMRRASTDPDAFEQARTERGWDAAISGIFTEQGAESFLTSRISRWLEKGLTRLFVSDSIMAELHGAGDVGSGVLDVQRFGRATPERSGMPRQFRVFLDSEADDTLRLRTTLYWETSRMLGSLAELEAIREAPDLGFQSMADALAHATDCVRVGTTLSGPSGDALPECDSQCLEDLCQTALGDVWDQVSGSIPGITQLEITAAGPADLDSSAKPRGFRSGFSGVWVGVLALPSFTPINSARGPFTSDLE